MYLYEWGSGHLNNRRKIIVFRFGEVALETSLEILLHLLKQGHYLVDKGLIDQFLEFFEAVGLLGGAKLVSLLEIAVFKLDRQAGVGFENGDF